MLLVRHIKFLANLDKSLQTVNIIRIFSMDVLIDLEGIVEETHPSEAGGNHELPLDLSSLDLSGPLEEDDGLLKVVLLGVVHTKT